MTSITAPGLYFAVAPREEEPAPLRTDIAGFIGRTRRGPLGEAVRVVGWRHYEYLFGGLRADAHTSYSVRGYFENGGEIAHVIRVADAGSVVAEGEWKLADLDAVTDEWPNTGPMGGGFPSAQYRVYATSPGVWGNGLRVTFRYRLQGQGGAAEVDVTVQADGEPTEFFGGLAPADLVNAIAERSVLIRLEAQGPMPVVAAGTGPGPALLLWQVRLLLGQEQAALNSDYELAAQQLADIREVGLCLVPDLYQDLVQIEEQQNLYIELATHAQQQGDRLVLADPPPTLRGVNAALNWAEELRASLAQPALQRTTAVYYPRLRVPDPLGGSQAPLREIASAGHVGGVISRVDQQRGFHHTPANAEVYEAVDVREGFEEVDQGRLTENGVNLVRCTPGRGLQVWGGHTLDRELQGIFVAHRRLIHGLVRAIRRVAEPLVFDTNGPELWLSFVRATTTILLEAYRAGALKGARPEEAFRVRCDENTNPPAQRDLGQLLCEIELAPAQPMEFILLRIAVSSAGRLELFET